MKKLGMLLAGMFLLSSCSLIGVDIGEVTNEDIVYDITDSILVAHLIESKSDKPNKIDIKGESLKVVIAVDEFLKDYNGEINMDFILSGVGDHHPELDKETLYLIKRILIRSTKRIKFTIDATIEQRMAQFKEIISLTRKELEKSGL
jgi:hypothetical protein